MTVPANTAVATSFSTLREDLEDIVYKISPTDTPVMQMIGRKGDFENTYHEWSIVELEAANADNKQTEGANVSASAAITPIRLGNYAQLMEKCASVSSTSQRVKVAGNVGKMAKQILFKTQALKTDMEARLCSNKAAVNSDPRETAGIGGFLFTNTSRGATGTNPTLSGTTTGYPNAAPGNGTQRAFTEDLLKPVIQAAWEQGGNPSRIIVGGFNKVQASGFIGNAQRTKDAMDKKLVATIDIYVSDFGSLQIVPDRFTITRQALILDPEMVEIGWLQPMQNTALAKIGHSDQRMVWAEWGVIVGNQKAHGIVADLTTS